MKQYIISYADKYGRERTRVIKAVDKAHASSRAYRITGDMSRVGRVREARGFTRDMWVAVGIVALSLIGVIILGF
jgi:hypothetical protein